MKPALAQSVMAAEPEAATTLLQLLYETLEEVAHPSTAKTQTLVLDLAEEQAKPEDEPEADPEYEEDWEQPEAAAATPEPQVLNLEGPDVDMEDLAADPAPLQPEASAEAAARKPKCALTSACWPVLDSLSPGQCYKQSSYQQLGSAALVSTWMPKRIAALGGHGHMCSSKFSGRREKAKPPSPPPKPAGPWMTYDRALPPSTRKLPRKQTRSATADAQADSAGAQNMIACCHQLPMGDLRCSRQVYVVHGGKVILCFSKNAAPTETRSCISSTWSAGTPGPVSAPPAPEPPAPAPAPAAQPPVHKPYAHTATAGGKGSRPSQDRLQKEQRQAAQQQPAQHAPQAAPQSKAGQPAAVVPAAAPAPSTPAVAPLRQLSHVPLQQQTSQVGPGCKLTSVASASRKVVLHRCGTCGSPKALDSSSRTFAAAQPCAASAADQLGGALAGSSPQVSVHGPQWPCMTAHGCICGCSGRSAKRGLAASSPHVSVQDVKWPRMSPHGCVLANAVHVRQLLHARHV